jgi:hypothetical protein
MICGFCKWYRPTGADGTRARGDGNQEAVGYCHRYPPSLRSVFFQGVGGEVQTAALSDGPFHPRVQFNDFCGEFAERVKP